MPVMAKKPPKDDDGWREYEFVQLSELGVEIIGTIRLRPVEPVVPQKTAEEPPAAEQPERVEPPQRERPQRPRMR